MECYLQPYAGSKHSTGKPWQHLPGKSSKYAQRKGVNNPSDFALHTYSRPSRDMYHTFRRQSRGTPTRSREGWHSHEEEAKDEEHASIWWSYYNLYPIQSSSPQDWLLEPSNAKHQLHRHGHSMCHSSILDSSYFANLAHRLDGLLDKLFRRLVRYSALDLLQLSLPCLPPGL